MSGMYTVAGVTGHTGRVVAETLLAKGLPTRVIVRDEKKGASWKGRGAEVAVADLADEATLTRALQGATGAYLLPPPVATTTDFVGSRARMFEAIGRAAVNARLPHLVFLSSIAAHLPKGTGPIVAAYMAERSCRKTRDRRDVRAPVVLSRELRLGAAGGEERRHPAVLHAGQRSRTPSLRPPTSGAPPRRRSWTVRADVVSSSSQVQSTSRPPMWRPLSANCSTAP